MKHARVPVTVSLPSNLAESFEKAGQGRIEKQKSAIQGDAHGL